MEADETTWMDYASVVHSIHFHLDLWRDAFPSRVLMDIIKKKHVERANE